MRALSRSIHAGSPHYPPATVLKRPWLPYNPCILVRSSYAYGVCRWLEPLWSLSFSLGPRTRIVHRLIVCNTVPCLLSRRRRCTSTIETVHQLGLVAIYAAKLGISDLAGESEDIFEIVSSRSYLKKFEKKIWTVLRRLNYAFLRRFKSKKRKKEKECWTYR